MEKRKSEKIDMSKYIGAKKSDGESYKIYSAVVQKHEKFGFSIKMDTELIELTPEDKVKLADKDIRASVMFKIGFDENTNEFHIIENSKLDKFLISKKIDFEKIPSDITINQDLEIFWGVPVTIQMKENGFLTFI